MGVCYIICFSFLLQGITSQNTFKAAVYEHNVVHSKNGKVWVNRSVALSNMMKNIEVLKTQANIAGEQGADILVFPEYGITGIGFNRQGIESYLEYIPDPEKESWNPCQDPGRYNNTEIQRSLSCMAKNNSLYIVANMGNIQPCNHQTDPKCPSDGRYQFNTDVVYDLKGNLIARYHKIKLFYEFYMDFPPIEKTVSFETPFGKFGIIICFDILFKTPAIDLLENHNVGNIVFSTAWMDALPVLAAIQFHSGFAAGSNVNFLAANIKYPEKKFHGSGIYLPSGYKMFVYDDIHRGSLLIADIPIIWNRTKNNMPDSTMANLGQIIEENIFQSAVFHDLYNFILLNVVKGKSNVCHGNLCCGLSYEKDKNTDELFAFGAFDGLHTYEGTYYIQVCILLKCKNSSSSSCGEPEKQSSTRFNYINMRGSFSTAYIFPEILLSNKSNQLRLSAPNNWKYERGVLQSENGFEYPVISAGMFARVYEKDSVTNETDSNRSMVIVMLTTLSFMLLLRLTG